MRPVRLDVRIGRAKGAYRARGNQGSFAGLDETSAGFREGVVRGERSEMRGWEVSQERTCAEAYLLRSDPRHPSLHFKVCWQAGRLESASSTER